MKAQQICYWLGGDPPKPPLGACSLVTSLPRTFSFGDIKRGKTNARQWQNYVLCKFGFGWKTSQIPFWYFYLIASPWKIMRYIIHDLLKVSFQLFLSDLWAVHNSCEFKNWLYSGPKIHVLKTRPTAALHYYLYFFWYCSHVFFQENCGDQPTGRLEEGEKKAVSSRAMRLSQELDAFNWQQDGDDTDIILSDDES